MLKYLYVSEVFSEVPGEISLGISITGCKIHCFNCHSKELWEDKGIPLTIAELDNLIEKHQGVTCLLLMGGEHDMDYLLKLFTRVKARYQLKTAWYCGYDVFPKFNLKMLDMLDYIKIGGYKDTLGGLDKPTTNQRMYAISHEYGKAVELKNITKKFQRK